MAAAITFDLYAPQPITFSLEDLPELEIELDARPSSGGSPYTGEYQVTPKTNQAVKLETNGKLLQDDVTVLRIPQFEVSNQSGGKTLIIGEEYYG